ncbi:putative manganese transporter [Romboutsia sp.]|uniref:putative manganese transporter n=1 Tax=Romboutsia sp. TaxID=1965302 RepID=UPI003F3EEF72
MEILEIIIHASQEAFLHVGVSLALVILAFGYIDYKTKGRLVNLLEINPMLQPIIGSILGIIPGCGGTILLIPLYTKNKVRFGTLISSLIASMGDAAFILMAVDIQKYILVSIISFITAIITGYIVDGLKLDKVLKLREKAEQKCNCNNYEETNLEKYIDEKYKGSTHIGHIENDEVDHILHHSNKKKVSDSVYKFTHSMGYKLFYLLIIVGLVFTILTNDGGLVHSHDHHEGISFEMIISIIGVGLSAIYMIISKKSIENSTHEIVESKYLSFKEMIIHSACESAFVITWIFVGYVVYEVGVLLIGGQEVVNVLLLASGVISIFIGALLGIIPGCGIQIMFISLYSNGAIPFAALISNSISQDGDALFPLIALDKKSAFWATVLTTIPAILIGLIVYY